MIRHNPDPRTTMSARARRDALAGALAAALAIVVLPQAAARADPACPIDQTAGQITKIAGDASSVTLRRSGRTVDLSASRYPCVLYNDRLDVGTRALVNVETGEGGGHYYGGPNHPSSWSPVSPGPPAPHGVREAILAAYRGWVDPAKPPPVYGMSRRGGARDCPIAPDPAAPPIGRAAAVSTTPQVVGDDLQALVAPWSPAGRQVRATLERADGSVIAQADDACGDLVAVIDLRGVALHPDDQLKLVAKDLLNGTQVEYPVRVVRPDTLTQPPKPLAAPWLIAAWRIAQGDKAAELDSLTRLNTASTTSYGARSIFRIIVGDQRDRMSNDRDAP